MKSYNKDIKESSHEADKSIPPNCPVLLQSFKVEDVSQFADFMQAN